MTTRLAWLVASVVAVLALIAVACGDSNVSLSPVAPSGLGGSTTTATITGRVYGGSSFVPSMAWMTSTASTASTSGLTVRVAGTGISSSVDGLGQFTLTNVPSGTVRLEFTGSGTSATITISGISAGDRIEIVVLVNGSSASLQSHVVEVEGSVAGLTGTCPSLTFTVRGRSVSTSGATSFEDAPCAMIQNNSAIEVKGRVQSDGSIEATSVEIEDEDDDDVELEGTVNGLSGSCPALTFLLNATTVITDNRTRFDEGGGCSSVQNGRRVEVTGTMQANGHVLAVEVELDD